MLNWSDDDSGNSRCRTRIFSSCLLREIENPRLCARSGEETCSVDLLCYSSIYGTDCPAVDTLLLQEELGRLLAWEDLQQFIGRLRRDGLCIFFSLGTLRKAVLGSHVEAEEIQRTINFQKAVVETTLKLVESKKYDSASGALEPLAEQFGLSLIHI